jgi:hypothetical protein
MPWMQYQYQSILDSTLLEKSLGHLDSIDCMPPNQKTFMLKLSVYSLLHRYDEGISYIESIDSTYFKSPYRRNIYVKSLEAKKASFMKDTVQATSLYEGIANELQVYLDKHSPNDAALMDLFEIKQKIEPKDKLIDEINELKKQGKYDSSLLDMIIEGLETRNRNF